MREGRNRGTERKKGRGRLGDDGCFEMARPRLPKTGREERKRKERERKRLRKRDRQTDRQTDRLITDRMRAHTVNGDVEAC